MFELKSGKCSKSKKATLFLFVFLLSSLADPAALAQGAPAQPGDPPQFRRPGMQMPGGQPGMQPGMPVPGMQMPPANRVQRPGARAGRPGMLRRGIGRQRKIGRASCRERVYVLV